MALRAIKGVNRVVVLSFQPFSTLPRLIRKVRGTNAERTNGMETFPIVRLPCHPRLVVVVVVSVRRRLCEVRAVCHAIPADGVEWRVTVEWAN